MWYRTSASPSGAWRRYWHMIVLGCWAIACFVRFARHGGIAWHFFTTGGSLLFGGGSGVAPPGGLHLYANYPRLQIGPLAFVLTEGLRQLGPHQGVFVTEALLMALGLYLLHELTRIATIIRPELVRQSAALRMTILVGGAFFLIDWAELSATFVHLDDAVALMLAVLAVRAAVAEHPILTGLCIGLATDCKPWALVFVPIVLVLPIRAWVRAIAVALVTIAVAWLPFAVADHHTVAAMHYTIRNLPGSGLRALGVRDPRTPSWDRSAQFLIGCGLGVIATWRGRWPAVILLGVGARIALDPADWGYYTAGVLLGALLWDLVGMHRPIPLWTLTSFAALAAVRMVTTDNTLLGQLRLGLVIGFTVVILLGPPWRRSSERSVRAGVLAPSEPG